MPRKKKVAPKPPLFSQMIEESGIVVRIFERTAGGVIQIERRSDSAPSGKERQSLGVKDRETAEADARAYCRRLGDLKRAGNGDPVKLRVLFDLYLTEKGPELSPARLKMATTTAKMFCRCWGDDLDVDTIGQGHVNKYQRERQSGELSPAHVAEPRAPGASMRGVRTKPTPVRAGAVNGDLRWLSAVFSWAYTHRPHGQRLVANHPLKGLKRPQEKNPRRPVSDVDRYVATMEKADEADPKGRLRCVLALCYYQGRRNGSVRQLRASDLLLTPTRIREALAAYGRDVRDADSMPYGAVIWRAETDKMEFLDLAPLHPEARAELDLYLSREPRIGDVPLFAGERGEAANAPLRRETLAGWLLKAEELAGLPKLKGGVFHPFRRLFATARKGLPDADVAAGGGWRSTQALKGSYQRAQADTTYRAILNQSG